MAIRLNGSTSGYVELDAPATAGSNTLTLPNGNGTSGQYLQTDGSGTLSWQTVASLSNAEDGTGTNFEFNSGFGSNGVAYGVRAWINFDGSAATIGTGRGSGNMDAVTDNGTGDYTVNFTNDMPDANYGVMHTGGVRGDQWGLHLRHSTVAPTVSAYRFTNVTPGDVAADVSLSCIAFVR